MIQEINRNIRERIRATHEKLQGYHSKEAKGEIMLIERILKSLPDVVAKDIVDGEFPQLQSSSKDYIEKQINEHGSRELE